MSVNSQDADRILTQVRPVVLDWYDGEVQAVVADPPTGHWYIFAVSLVPDGRRFVVVRVGSDAFEEAEAIEKFASDEAVMAFGGKVLASVGDNATAFEVEIVGNSVANIRALSKAELSVLQPRSAEDLFVG